MWEPSAPPSGHQQNLNNIDVNNYSVHIAGLKNGVQQKEQFLLCKSTMKHRDSVSDSEDDDTIKSGCFAAKKSSNELVIDLKVKKANIMLQTASLVGVVLAHHRLYLICSGRLSFRMRILLDNWHCTQVRSICFW